MKLAPTLALCATAAAALVLFAAPEASAQKKKQPEVFTLNTIEIVARPTRPSAVVELGKIFPEPQLANLRHPFIAKIEEAIAGEPF